jgi:hypothetical protein
MRTLVACAVVAVTVLVLARMTAVGDEKKASEPQIAHAVYFTLKDSSAESRKAVVDACKKYLSGYDGQIFFACGTIDDSFKKDNNIKDWDVAMYMLFKDRAAYDKYDAAARHKQFITENKARWKTTHIYDADVMP